MADPTDTTPATVFARFVNDKGTLDGQLMDNAVVVYRDYYQRCQQIMTTMRETSPMAMVFWLMADDDLGDFVDPKASADTDATAGTTTL